MPNGDRLALLDDKDKAIAALTRSADAKEGQILYLWFDPFFDEIRSDPRYEALEKRIGLIRWPRGAQNQKNATTY